MSHNSKICGLTFTSRCTHGVRCNQILITRVIVAHHRNINFQHSSPRCHYCLLACHCSFTKKEIYILANLKVHKMVWKCEKMWYHFAHYLHCRTTLHTCMENGQWWGLSLISFGMVLVYEKSLEKWKSIIHRRWRFVMTSFTLDSFFRWLCEGSSPTKGNLLRLFYEDYRVKAFRQFWREPSGGLLSIVDNFLWGSYKGKRQGCYL